jgi:hypothetical protein
MTRGGRARLTCVLTAPHGGSCVSGQSPLQITSCVFAAKRLEGDGWVVLYESEKVWEHSVARR